MSQLVQKRPRRIHPAATVDLAHELSKGFAHRFIRHKSRQLVGRYGYTPSDREELDQELKMRLIERFSQFDPQKSDWPAFVTTVVERQIATLLESRCRLKRYGDGTAVSLATEASDEDGLILELADQVTLEHQQAVSREFNRADTEWTELEHDVAAVLDQLSPEDRQLCDALKRESIAQVARTMRVPRTTLYSLVARVRQAFEAAGLRDFL